MLIPDHIVGHGRPSWLWAHPYRLVPGSQLLIHKARKQACSQRCEAKRKRVMQSSQAGRICSAHAVALRARREARLRRLANRLRHNGKITITSRVQRLAVALQSRIKLRCGATPRAKTDRPVDLTRL
jgi:hypothetical protein